MVRKALLIIAFSILVLAIQGIIVPKIAISNVKPDLILILVIFVGRLEGKVVGELFGFFIGLIADFIGVGSFLGLSALSKTIAGYLAGSLWKKERSWNPIYFHTMEVLIFIIHFSIVFFVNFKGSELTAQYIFVRYVLTYSAYSLVFYYLTKHFSGLILP